MARMSVARYSSKAEKSGGLPVVMLTHARAAIMQSATAHTVPTRTPEAAAESNVHIETLKKPGSSRETSARPRTVTASAAARIAEDIALGAGSFK